MVQRGHIFYFLTPESNLVALNVAEALQRQGQARCNHGAKVMSEGVLDFDLEPDGRIVAAFKTSVARLSTDKSSM